jgi:hypothetical protein
LRRFVPKSLSGYWNIGINNVSYYLENIFFGVINGYVGYFLVCVGGGVVIWFDEECLIMLWVAWWWSASFYMVLR